MSGALPGSEELVPGIRPADATGATERVWPAPQMRVRHFRRGEPGRPPAGSDRDARRTTGSGRAAKPPRRPVVALAGMIVFGLLAAFFAWQSAEPVWLALGRSETGTATLTRCDAATGAAVAPGAAAASYRCVAFTAPGRPPVADVTLLGADLKDGGTVPARMVTTGHGRAYAVSTAGLHVRWFLGLGLVALCGAGVAWATGATRTRDPHLRRRAVLLSYAGPALLAAGFLAAAW